MKYIIIFITAFLTSVILISCSDINEDITRPELPGYHEKGINNPLSDVFHGKLIRENNWSMKNCAQCHAGDYSGGVVQSSCLTCHTQPKGPEACNTCHGDFADPSRIAPPRALNESIDKNYPGVGAHVSHLYNNKIGADISCSNCHIVPSGLYSEGHLGDDNKAEINFGALAIAQGVSPNYNFQNNTCSDTYCHGNFVFYRDSSNFPQIYTAPTMRGNNFLVKWNQFDPSGSQAQCGSCHGIPPLGHQPFAITQCATCHTGVVDAQGNILDRSKHINGVINVFGN
jgi:hypothetical protein